MTRLACILLICFELCAHAPFISAFECSQDIQHLCVECGATGAVTYECRDGIDNVPYRWTPTCTDDDWYWDEDEVLNCYIAYYETQTTCPVFSETLTYDEI